MSPEALERPKVDSWIYERQSATVLSAIGTTRTLYQGRSRYQSIEIHENPEFGKLLFLDQELQSATRDEFIYHEALVHPALLAHPAPRRVAILGGGEGATLREVLRHPSVEWAAMIDIDGEVVEVCRRELPEYADGAFEDPRSRLVIGDAKAWLAACDEPLDVIVSDLTEPKSTDLSTSLFSTGFFATVRSRLGAEGVFSLQASMSDLVNLSRHRAIRSNLNRVFRRVRSLSCHVPSFRCLWGFAVASDSLDPGQLTPAQVDARLAERRITGLRFYDGETHRRLFSLPRYIREQIET